MMHKKKEKKKTEEKTNQNPDQRKPHLIRHQSGNKKLPKPITQVVALKRKPERKKSARKRTTLKFEPHLTRQKHCMRLEIE